MHADESVPSSTPRFPTLALALAGAALGAWWAAGPGFDPYANGDARSFEALARSLLAGRGLVYREPMLGSLDLYAYRSPVYAAFAALGFALGGVRTVLALQGALAGATCALVGRLAARLGGAGAGLLAFAIALLWPMGRALAGQLMTESLYTSIVIATTVLAFEAASRQSRAYAGAAGVCATLAALTRPVGLGLVAGVAAWLGRRAPRLALVFVAAAAIAWAPWPVRNALRLHAFVPLLTQGGINAWAGNTPGRISEGWELMARTPGLDERGYDRMFVRLTAEHARARPRDVARRLAWKTVETIVPLERDPAAWLGRLVTLIAAIALFARRVRERAGLLAWVWLGHALLGIATIAGDRYRYPTEWIPVVIASLGIASGIGGRSRADRGARD